MINVRSSILHHAIGLLNRSNIRNSLPTAQSLSLSSLYSYTSQLTAVPVKKLTILPKSGLTIPPVPSASHGRRGRCQRGAGQEEEEESAADGQVGLGQELHAQHHLQ